MYNYEQQIKEFIGANFQVSTPENANVKMTSESLLAFLFRVFPEGCISDYELNDIMLSLGYKRLPFTYEEYMEMDSKNKPKVYHIIKSLGFGWCLKSELDLATEEVFDKPKN
ncbi:MAG: hypothetical protein V4670_12145 [Bacteroidota bacterium]